MFACEHARLPAWGLAQRFAFVPLLAKAKERAGGAFQLGLAHIVPPRHPFGIERMNVISRRGRFSVVHRFRVDIGRVIGNGDRIGLGLEARTVAEPDHVIVYRDGIVGEMAVIGVVLADLLDQGPEHPERAV